MCDRSACDFKINTIATARARAVPRRCPKICAPAPVGGLSGAPIGYSLSYAKGVACESLFAAQGVGVAKTMPLFVRLTLWPLGAVPMKYVWSARRPVASYNARRPSEFLSVSLLSVRGTTRYAPGPSVPCRVKSFLPSAVRRQPVRSTGELPMFNTSTHSPLASLPAGFGSHSLITTMPELSTDYVKQL